MKKKIFLFCFLFIGYSIFAQVNVEIIDLKINNLTQTNINFNSQSTLNIKFRVNLKTFNGDHNNILGNLIVHTKKLTNSNSIVRDVKPITFTVTYPPFVSETTYNGVTDIDLNISNTEFYQNGGVLFVEYKNNNSQSFFSSNINILGGIIPDNVILPTGTNTICCNQVVRYGDKPQNIVGTNIDSNRQLTWLKYDTNSNYIGPVGQNGISNNNGRNLLSLDYIFSTVEYKRFINPSDTQNGGWSNKVRIEVIPNPIISNYISSQAVNLGNNEYEVYEGDLIDFVSQTSFAYPSLINDPFRIPNRRTEPSERVTEYQWQYSKDSSNWIDISGEVNSSLYSFLPQDYSNNKFKVRRIAKYQGISLVSNTLSFLVRNSNPNSNYICCDQSLTSDSSGVIPPDTLIGNTVVFNYSDANVNTIFNILSSDVTYKWQIQTRGSSWNDLNIFTKDYLPTDYPTRPNSFYSYRRVAEVNYTKRDSRFSNNPIISGTYILYSMPVSIGVNSVRSRISNELTNEYNYETNYEYNVFPNPASSNINVYLKSNESNLKLYNNFGILLKDIYEFDKNDNLLNIDVSNLTRGIYLLIIENQNGSYKKKIIIE